MEKNIKVSAIVSCFNGSKYLPEFLENCSKQTILDNLEIVLVHNQPSEEEKQIVEKFMQSFPGLISYMPVAREPFAVSFNRGQKTAKGEYICVWNIDDLRTKDSLELMVKTLDENKEVGFTYGDFIIVHKWLSQEGKLITTPEFNKTDFSQSMILGPFYMWRKSLNETLGYWDEQFKSGSDFDHAVRLALGSTGKKTAGMLGYYLDEGLGLSTGKTPWQKIERTAIELRFGIYHKLDFWYLTAAKKYNLKEISVDGKWYPLINFQPDYLKFAENKFMFAYALLRYPFWIVKRVVNRLIKLFRLKWA